MKSEKYQKVKEEKKHKFIEFKTIKQASIFDTIHLDKEDQLVNKNNSMYVNLIYRLNLPPFK